MASEAFRAVILTNAKIFQFLPDTCRIIGQHASGRKENLTVREYSKHSRQNASVICGCPSNGREEAGNKIA